MKRVTRNARGRIFGLTKIDRIGTLPDDLAAILPSGRAAALEPPGERGSRKSRGADHRASQSRAPPMAHIAQPGETERRSVLSSSDLCADRGISGLIGKPV